MPPVIKSAPPKSRGGLLRIILLLAAVLAVLFCRSFLPGYVHFSNDGPLAMQVTECLRPPATFFGAWFDLCWIGSNLSSLPFGVASFLRTVLGAVGYAKFLAPLAILIFGVCTWVFLKRLKLTPLACVLGAFAAALNSAFLGTACWGVAGQIIGFGFDYLALAMVVSNSSETPRWLRWVRLILAGFAVGVGVIEGADNGAIFSMFVAAFVFYKSLIEEEGSAAKNVGRGIGRVAVIAVFAAIIATQNLTGLITTAIQGVAGTKQDARTKEAQWDWATQWSTPKIETLNLFVPGLFGYRMDTPKDMPEFLQNHYKGGNYWGKVGRDPAWDRYFAGNGPEPDANSQYIRFSSGAGLYSGVLVVLVALWAFAQSFRKNASVFSLSQRRFIWFWGAAMVISLLLAYGRFAPFYRFLYMLPYFSTIRNPCKFTAVFSWSLIIVFSYGIHGLSRRYLEVVNNSTLSPLDLFKSWWAKKQNFDRKWLWGCFIAIAFSLVGWLLYWLNEDKLVTYLQTVRFPGDMAKVIAAFSIRQVGWFILFLILGVIGLAGAFCGAFAGKRNKVGRLFLGIILVADLGHADLPYIVHWDYKQKYEVGFLNPIITFLAEKPYEQRVMRLPFDTPPQMSLLGDLYKIEWSQQLFPYYNILQLDIIQMPRRTEDFMAFEGALAYRNDPDSMFLIPRRWELTSTRYLLGAMVTSLPMGNVRTLDFLNQGLDAGKARFHIIKQFDIVQKPGVVNATQYDQLTAVENTNGNYALFEFDGAVPHAALFNHWQVITNDEVALDTLSSSNFSPQQTVIVSKPLPTAPPAAATAQKPGDVKFVSYHPTDIVLEAHAETDAVLLFNDHYDATWRVFVDGKPAELLRCNYIMRGVFLPPGEHKVEFIFRVPIGPGYITLTAMALGILLSALMIYSERRMAGEENSTSEITSKKTLARGNANTKNPRS